MAAHSVSHLIYQLGGDADVLAIPAGLGDDVQHVGLLAGLPVWTTTSGPVETLKRARRIARRGMLGVLIGCEPVTDRWTITVTVQPVRLTALAAADAGALPLLRVARAARTVRGSALEHAIARSPTRSTWTQPDAGRSGCCINCSIARWRRYRLPYRGDGHLDTRSALAQITRLLFLRFVESEGWLDGNPRFLADAFDRCLIAKRDPTRHLLHPLFLAPAQSRVG